MPQFENLRASTLYCRKCGSAMPVRESLLLVLPGKEVYDYLCVQCGESVGRKETASQQAGAKLWTPS